jgi:hypothetical protein
MNIPPLGFAVNPPIVRDETDEVVPFVMQMEDA